MRFYMALLLAIASIYSCAGAQADPISKEALATGAEVFVRPRLKDPDSAQFSGLHGNSTIGGDYFCGYVNAKNGFGGYSGAQRFVGVVKEAFVGQVTFEQQTAHRDFEKLWAYCDDKAPTTAKKAR